MHRLPVPGSLLALFLACSTVVQAESAPDSPPTEPPKKDLSPQPGTKPAAPSARSILNISLNGPVYERTTVPPFFFSTAKPVELFSLFRAFQKAKSDPSITGILLRIGTLGAGWGKCQELREMIQEFRASGKKVWAWLPFGTNREYFVASAADEVIMPPAGLLLVMGLRAEVTFLKGLLDKIGVEAEIIHVGAYKGSGEPYMRTEMSPEFRETVENLVDDVMTTYVLGASKSLGMEAMAFEKLLDDGPFHAPEAQKRKLIARIAYLDEFLDEISEKGKVKLLPDSKYVGDGLERPDLSNLPGVLSFLSQLTAPPVVSRSPNPKLALIYAVGPILNESVSGLPGGDDTITAAPLVKAFDSARKDPTVKAVILRVDSPGGDIITSDLIWRAVEKTDKVKPVVVSMSDVGASGGYYISMPARAIVAHRATITGSIGVLGGKFNLEKLYGLVGAKVEIVERGRGSGLFSAHHKLTDEERQRLYNLLKQSYDLFLQKASQGRKDKVKDMSAAAEGRAWTGGRAFEMGLVDALGGLREAFSRAKQLAGMKPEDKLELMVFPRQKTLFDLFGGETEDVKSALPAALIPAPLKPEMWRDLSVLFMLSERKVLVHTPCRIEVR